VLGRELPQMIHERGREIRLFMPRFGNVNERRNQLHEVIRLSGMNLIIDDTDHPLIIKVASMPGGRIQVYFIDNEEYFQRKGDAAHEEDGKPFADNDERTIFFARGVLETVKKLRWKPAVIHCQGWFTFLIAFYLKKHYKDDPLFARAKIVLAVSEQENLPGTFNARMKDKMILGGIRPKDVELLAKPNFENYMQLCMQHSDGVIFFGSKRNATVDKIVKRLRKPSILVKKSAAACVDECNEFYFQVTRTR